MERKEFGQMAAKMRPRLLKTARQFFGNTEDAEDAVQDALLRLWSVRARVRQGEEEALAKRIVRNCCVSLWRKQQQGSRVSLEEARAAASGGTAIDTIVSDEETRRIEAAKARLPRAHRRLLQMKADTDMSLEEIAAAAGIKRESASAMISTARKLLYEALKHQERRK